MHPAYERSRATILRGSIQRAESDVKVLQGASRQRLLYHYGSLSNFEVVLQRDYTSNKVGRLCRLLHESEEGHLR